MYHQPGSQSYLFVLTHDAEGQLRRTGRTPESGVYAFYDERIGEGKIRHCCAGSQQRLVGLLLFASQRGIQIKYHPQHTEIDLEALKRPTLKELTRLFEDASAQGALDRRVQAA